MKRLTTVVAMIGMVLFALPASAHTTAEYDAWIDQWESKWAEAGAITPELIAEISDFHDRHPNGRPHPPQAKATTKTTSATPATSSSTDSVNRGMGTNVEQWRGLVSAYFGSQTDLALCVMLHESGGNPNARNSSSGAAGLFQVMPFWWDHYGGDRYDPETNTRVASLILASQGWTAWAAYNRGKCS